MKNMDVKINAFISRGVIESNIEFAKNNNMPLSVVKFSYDIDFKNLFLFKDVISFMHSLAGFDSILLQPNDTFILFLKNCKIHDAKSTVAQILQKIQYKFKIEIKHVGIALLDENDTYKTLLDRLSKYYTKSKLSSQKKIFCGTLDFDFYSIKNDMQVLKNIFEKLNTIKLFNFHQNLPITEKVKILNYNKGSIQLEINPIKFKLYKNEKFTFIKHDLIPVIIKASIVKIKQEKSIIVLGDFEFPDSSPVERSSTRIEPVSDMNVSLSLDNKKIVGGVIASLSEDSVAIYIKPQDIKALSDKPLWNTELILQFQVPTNKSFTAIVKTKAMIYSIVNNKIVLHITPSKLMKEKLKNYILVRQSEILLHLKKEIKMFRRNI
ncbi:MAG: hypothetical protein JJV95_02885 [Sulfurospirillum sp.]|nr:hypothetical protein [Sulfurospirillum sp.]MBL0702916.1 hypothetical protein [Sulfurospirillum sp.]